MARAAAGLAASVVLAAGGCAGKGSATAKPTPPPQVQTVKAAAGTLAPSLEIAGMIVPYRQIAVTANLSEPIMEVDVVEGQHVHAGQVLARQLTDDLNAQLVSAERVVREDAARYAQAAYQTRATTSQDVAGVVSARDSLHEAEVNLSGAQTDLKRYQTLELQGYMPAQTLDQQRIVVATDRQAVDAARAALAAAVANNSANGNGQNAGVQLQELEAARAAADAAQATVEQLKLEISRAVIVAPVDGVVDSANVNPGEYPSGRQLFTIEQNSRVYASLPASTAQVVDVRPGAAASIEINTSYRADPHARKDHGTVEAVLDQVQPGTTNFTVKVLLDNADGHLRAGMPVNAFVDLPLKRGIIIPETAFVDDTHTTVYAVDAGVVHLKPVGVVAEDGARAVVTGLASGEAVIQNVDATNVGNGDRVNAALSPAPSK